MCSSTRELRASLSHFYTCLVSVAILRQIEFKQATGFGCGLGWDNVVGIATHYRLDSPGDRIPVGMRYSAHVQTGPGDHPTTSSTVGTGFMFRWVKAAGAWRQPPTPI